jgi:GNAT superfamily N-acetyltransferase
MKIRAYEQRDFPDLLLLGGEMHSESDFSPFAFSPDYVRKMEEVVLSSSDRFCFVAETDEGIAGTFVGGVQEFFFGPDRYGFDFLLYVRPQWRGSSAAYRLVLAATAFCRNAGAKQLRFGVSTGINPADADRFYRKLGFVNGGALYTRML